MAVGRDDLLYKAHQHLEDILIANRTIGALGRFSRAYNTIDPATGHRKLYVIRSIHDVLAEAEDDPQAALKEYASQIAARTFNKIPVDDLQGKTGRFIIVDDNDLVLHPYLRRHPSMLGCTLSW